jgi:hypothetical protein
MGTITNTAVVILVTRGNKFSYKLSVFTLPTTTITAFITVCVLLYVTTAGSLSIAVIVVVEVALTSSLLNGPSPFTAMTEGFT